MTKNFLFLQSLYNCNVNITGPMKLAYTSFQPEYVAFRGSFIDTKSYNLFIVVKILFEIAGLGKSRKIYHFCNL